MSTSAQSEFVVNNWQKTVKSTISMGFMYKTRRQPEPLKHMTLHMFAATSMSLDVNVCVYV